jgi:CHRD domain
MLVNHTLRLLLISTGIVLFGGSASAQEDTFKARLSPVPVESSTAATITGSGSVTAVLAGRRLSITGSFEGLQTPATIAQIHLGPRGIRGPVMFDLTVKKASPATSGTVSGVLTLTPEQVEAVKSGRFYVQIHSEKAAEGNLWGWLLPITG